MVTYTIKNETAERFDKYAERMSVNRSAFIDKAINEKLDEFESTYNKKVDEIESMFDSSENEEATTNRFNKYFDDWRKSITDDFIKLVDTKAESHGFQNRDKDEK